MEEHARGHLGLDALEDVGKDGEELLEGGLGGQHLQFGALWGVVVLLLYIGGMGRGIKSGGECVVLWEGVRSFTSRSTSRLSCRPTAPVPKTSSMWMLLCACVCVVVERGGYFPFC